MPRIRSIKPEFFSDERLITLPIETRFAFFGLICFADDDGYVTANHRALATWIFHNHTVTTVDVVIERVARIIKKIPLVATLMQPILEAATTLPTSTRALLIDDAISELLTLKRIEVVCIDPGDEEFGRHYRIINFKKHQRIDKPQPSKVTLALQMKVAHATPESNHQLGLTLIEQRSIVAVFFKTRYPTHDLSIRIADILLEFTCRFDTDPRYIITQKIPMNARDPVAYLTRILDDNNPPLPKGAQKRIYSWNAWQEFVNANASSHKGADYGQHTEPATGAAK